MPRSKTPIVSLKEAKARFEEWRNVRRGKARIPVELWSAAVGVARKEGINPNRAGVACGVGRSEAAHAVPAGAVPRQPALHGVGHAADAIGSRMHIP